MLLMNELIPLFLVAAFLSFQTYMELLFYYIHSKIKKKKKKNRKELNFIIFYQHQIIQLKISECKVQMI